MKLSTTIGVPLFLSGPPIRLNASSNIATEHWSDMSLLVMPLFLALFYLIIMLQALRDVLIRSRTIPFWTKHPWMCEDIRSFLSRLEVLKGNCRNHTESSMSDGLSYRVCVCVCERERQREVGSTKLPIVTIHYCYTKHIVQSIILVIICHYCYSVIYYNFPLLITMCFVIVHATSLHNLVHSREDAYSAYSKAWPPLIAWILFGLVLTSWHTGFQQPANLKV
jgi:hypothetical protein